MKDSKLLIILIGLLVSCKIEQMIFMRNLKPIGIIKVGKILEL